MIPIDRHPSRRDLLIFALGLPVFFGVVGALRWDGAAPRTAIALWVVGGAVSLVALVVPRSRRTLYLGWMFALLPLAWAVSMVVLLAVYFLVTTPTAIVLRLLGRDPMQRHRFDHDAASYWVEREPQRDRARYFRQF